jgi:hypothetical protein
MTSLPMPSHPQKWVVVFKAALVWLLLSTEATASPEEESRHLVSSAPSSLRATMVAPTIRATTTTATVSAAAAIATKKRLGSIFALQLIDADSNTQIANLWKRPENSPLSNFTIVVPETKILHIPVNAFDPITLPLPKLTIKAAIYEGSVGSVWFGYNTTARYHVENQAPFTLCRNRRSNFLPCQVLTWNQEHTITVTPFTGRDGNGRSGQSIVLSFQLIPKPVPPPSPLCTRNPSTVTSYLNCVTLTGP